MVDLVVTGCSVSRALALVHFGVRSAQFVREALRKRLRNLVQHHVLDTHVDLLHRQITELFGDLDHQRQLESNRH